MPGTNITTSSGFAIKIMRGYETISKRSAGLEPVGISADAEKTLAGG
jgi:hypothetical protein